MTEQRIERIISQLADLSEDELSSVYAAVVEKQQERRKAKLEKAREELIKAWNNFVDLGGYVENNNRQIFSKDLDFYF